MTHQHAFEQKRKLLFEPQRIIQAHFAMTTNEQQHGRHAAVTRTDAEGWPEGGWRPEERMTREEALACFTRDAAADIDFEALDLAEVGEPCPCGRPMPVLRAVEGRTDDILHLPGQDGRSVPVHPLQFAPVAEAREVTDADYAAMGTGFDRYFGMA